MNNNHFNPPQQQGGSSDTTESIQLPSLAEAKNHFETVKQRLLRISDWGIISKGSPTTFELTTPDGEAISGNAHEGDLVKINIPAPGPEAGGGYDWVRVNTIKNVVDPTTDSESLAITVKPAKDPASDRSAPAHFFGSQASSTFIVNRTGNIVSAEVHGRNETPNIEGTEIIDSIRNTVVALGAILGFSELQWKALVKGLISKEAGK